MASYSKAEQAERWWALEGDEMAYKAFQIAMDLRKDQDYRERRNLSNLSMYQGNTASSLYGSSYTPRSKELEAESDLEFNVSRAGCDTVHAEIAGRQKPMAKFQTSDADWKIKRKAKKLEKFCQGILRQHHGQFLNGWQLMESAFLDACIFEAGVVKTYYNAGKIHYERHYSWELFVDPVEARYGEPKNLYHIYQMDLDCALYQFSEDPSLDISDEEREKIRRCILSSETTNKDVQAMSRNVRPIEIVECWRLRISEDEPGKHVFLCNGKLLYEEDWTRDSFPFVRMRWEQDRIGYYGKSLVEQGASIHSALTKNIKKMDERFDLCGSKRTYYEEGSVREQDLEANEAEVFVPYKKGAVPPTETRPSPINEAELNWTQFLGGSWYEYTGVSEAKATARKEPGVTAGVAIRTVNDMQTVRFINRAKMYESAYVELAQQSIICAKEAYEAGLEVKAGASKSDEIDWADIDVDIDLFDIQIAPASSLPSDPAGRMQMTTELYSSGIIGVDTYKQLLGWPDLEKTMNFLTSQRNYLEKLFDKILDADEGEVEFVYQDPNPYLINKPDALLQASQCYFDAMYDEAPEVNQEAMLRWVNALTKQLEMEAAAQAALAAPPPEMGMGSDLGEPAARAPVAAGGPPMQGPGGPPPAM